MAWNGTILEDDDEDEEEEKSYSFTVREPSEEDVEEALESKFGHVYSTFVEPVLEDGEEMTVEEVADEIRPPYSEEEIRGALEYGVENEGLEYVSEEGSVKKI